MDSSEEEKSDPWNYLTKQRWVLKKLQCGVCKNALPPNVMLFEALFALLYMKCYYLFFFISIHIWVTVGFTEPVMTAKVAPRGTSFFFPLSFPSSLCSFSPSFPPYHFPLSFFFLLFILSCFFLPVSSPLVCFLLLW